jgi:predicted methyltransferase
MKKLLVLTLNLLLVITACFAQPAGSRGQNEEKVKKLKFCGYRYKDSTLLRSQIEQQLAFLNIKNGDTIVDVGTSSGAYIGVLNTIGLFKNVHFILVDIDTNCLNRAKVNNMISYYEALHGAAFINTFSLVNNTPDSLNLPLHRFKKVWIMNTLHEIPDKAGMALQLAGILQPGGELIILEIPPAGKRTIHQGCNKPLMSEEEIKTLINANGFSFSAMENLQPVAKHRLKHPTYFYRFIKM